MTKNFDASAREVARWNPDIAKRWQNAARIAVARLNEKFEPRSSFAESISAEEVEQRIDAWAKGDKKRGVYGRIGNPEVWALEDAVSALQENSASKGAKIVAAARATSAGETAVQAAIEGSIQSGDHIVASKHVFGATRTYLDRVRKDFGIKVSYIDGRDSKEWENAIRKNTKMFVFETPANPLLHQIDVSAVSAIAHDETKGRDILVAVDGSMVSPLPQKVLQQGADMYALSVTKYISRGKYTGGVLLVSEEGGRRMERLNPAENKAAIASFKVINILKGADSLSPWNARHFLRQIVTLGPRFKHQSDVAHDLAQYLSNNLASRGIKVIYPGLKNGPLSGLSPDEHDQFMLAHKQMLKRPDGEVIGGGVFTIDVGNKEEAFRVLNILQKHGVSLETNFGQKKFHATHQATNTYKAYAPELQAECGITPGLLRFSPGDTTNLEQLKKAFGEAFGFDEPTKTVRPLPRRAQKKLQAS